MVRGFSSWAIVRDNAVALTNGCRVGWATYRSAAAFARKDRAVSLLMAAGFDPARPNETGPAARSALQRDFRAKMTRWR